MRAGRNDGHFLKQQGGNYACRIILLIVHLFLPTPWCFQVFGWVACLAIQMPNTCQATWLHFFKESCLQSHGHSSSCPAAAAMWAYRQLFVIRDSWHNGLIVQMQPVYCVAHVDPAQQSFVLCSCQGCCPISWVVSFAYKYLALCHKFCSWIAKHECWNPSSLQVNRSFVTVFNGVRCLCTARCSCPLRQQ